eukprot:TRINITY_DN17573_c0_g1_i1.p1 TRINITY_DN17573_c0_g1~~TRINITY_DN17573_c0_g1_i1.p1  ORF type:complete len:414 (+),score=158.17 TRINITY_DN17573_c0_g1_i1:47-1243(+)
MASEVFEIAAPKKPINFQIGAEGKSFDMFIKESGDVKVVFARDLSSCTVVCRNNNAEQVLEKLKTLTHEGKSLLAVFKPQLDTEAAEVGEQRALIGNKVHCYEVDGKTFEVYTGTGRELKYICERMQFFIYKLTEGLLLQHDLDADATQAFYTVCKDGSTWEIVGFASADEEYMFPDQEQLVIHQLLVLPAWQQKGHGSTLAAVIWKRARELGMRRVTWEPLADIPEDSTPFDVEAWIRPMHVARMIKMGIFRNYDSTVPLNGDAYVGNPMYTSWEKLRASKEAAYRRTFATPPKDIVWTRQGAEAAAAALLLPISTVRDLFEISLLKKDHVSPHVADFIKARLYLMDYERLASMDEKEAYATLQKIYSDMCETWKETARKTQRLRGAQVLPALDVQT